MKGQGMKLNRQEMDIEGLPTAKEICIDLSLLDYDITWIYYLDENGGCYIGFLNSNVSYPEIYLMIH